MTTNTPTAEQIARVISQHANTKVSYDSVGRQYAHVTNADNLSETILALFLQALTDAQAEVGNINAVATETYARLRSERDDAEAENARLRGALERMAEDPSPDPVHQAEVDSLGQRIGYGAMMCAASYGWRKSLQAYPGHDLSGGEFTVGPCRSRVKNLLALSTTKEG
jgi:hypothetical protein